MDSKKDKICKIFAILMLPLCLRSATATNIDCNGKPFHCVNSTHFMICVDLGAGVSRTVDNFVIQCPPTTECRRNNNFECEYPLETTTQSIFDPGDTTNDSTVDTEIIKTFPNDVINRITSITKTNVSESFKEYYNMIDDTTSVDYIIDTQTYKTNEVLDIPDIFVNDTNSKNESKLVTTTSETNSIENIVSKVIEINSQNDSLKLTLPKDEKSYQRDKTYSIKSEQEFSKQLFATDTTRDIDQSNIINSTASNSDFSIVISMDSSNDSVIDIKSASSTLINEEVTTTNVLSDAVTFRELPTYFTQTESSVVVTQSLSQDFTNTQIGFSKMYTTFNDDSLPYDQSISDTTENYNFKTMSSTLEPTITSTEHMATINDTISTYIFIESENVFFQNENGTVISPETELTTIVLNPLTSNYQLPNSLPSKSNTRIANTTAKFDYKSTTEQSISEPEKKIKQIVKENMVSSSTDINTLDVTSATASSDFDNTTSNSSEDQTKPLKLNLLGQILHSNPLNTSTSNEQDKSKVNFLDESTTIHEDIPNLSITSTPYLKSNDFTTLSSLDTLHSTHTFMENVTAGKERRKSITLSDYGVNDKTPYTNDISALEVTSTTTVVDELYLDNTISSVEYQTMTPEFNLLEQVIQDKQVNMSPSYGQDKPVVNFIDEITTKHGEIPNVSINSAPYMKHDDFLTLPTLDTLDSIHTFMKNVTDGKEQRKSITLSDYGVNDKTSYANDISALDVTSTTIVVDELYLDNTISSVEYQTMTPELNLLEQVIQDKQVNMSLSYGQDQPEVIFIDEITTTHGEIPNLSINSAPYMKHDDFSTLSTLDTLDSIHTFMKNVTDGKETTKSITLSNYGANDKTSYANNISALEVTSTRTVVDELYLDNTISSVEHQTTTTESNLLEQVIQDKKPNMSPSYGQDKSEVNFIDEITTTHGDIPNVSINSAPYMKHDDFSTLSTLDTLDSVHTLMENVTDEKEATKSITLSNYGANDKTSYANDISTLEVTSTTTIVKELYLNDAISSIAYQTTTPELNLLEQIIQDKKPNMSPSYGQDKPVVNFIDEITTTHGEIPNVSINSAPYMKHDDFSTLSTLDTLDSIHTFMKNVTDAKEARKSITLSDYRVNDKTSYANDISALEVTSTTTVVDELFLDNTISSVEYQTMIPELNLLEQVIQDKQVNMSPSYGQDKPVVNFIDEITTTHGEIPNVPINSEPYMKHDDFSTLSTLDTLDSIHTFMKNVTNGKEPRKSITLSDYGVNDKTYYANGISALEVTSTTTVVDELYLDDTISSAEHQTTTPELNLLELVIRGKQLNILPSYIEDKSEVKLLDEITTAHGIIPNESINTALYLKHDNFSNLSTLDTLHSRQTFMEMDSTDTLLDKNTILHNNAINDKSKLQYEDARQMSTQAQTASTILNAIPLSYNVSATAKESEMAINNMIVFGMNNLTNKITTNTSQLNLIDQNTEVIVMENLQTYPNSPQDNKFPAKEENILDILYLYTTSINVDSVTLKPALVLEKQVIQNSTSSVSSVDEQFMSEEPVSKDILSINLMSANLSANNGFLPSSDGITTLSPLTTFEQKVMGQNTDRKEVTERTTVPINNVHESIFLQEENSADSLSELNDHTTSFNSSQSEYIFSTTGKFVINETTLRFVYENLTSVSDIATNIDKGNYSNKIKEEYQPPTNSNVMNDTKNNKSQNKEETIINTTMQYSTINSRNAGSNMEMNKRISIQPEGKATSETILQLQILEDVLLNDTNFLSNIKEPTIPTYNTLASSLVNPEYNHVTTTTTTEMTKTTRNVNNDNTMPAVLQHGILLSTIVKKPLQEKNVKDKTNHMGLISNVDDVNKYPIKATVQNEQAYGDNTSLKPDDRVITETSVWEAYYKPKSEKLFTNDIIATSTTETLITTLVTNLDETLSKHNHSEQNPKDVVTNNENSPLKNNIASEQNNRKQQRSGHSTGTAFNINLLDPEQKVTSDILSTDVEQQFKITKSTEPIDSTNNQLFQKLDKRNNATDTSSTVIEDRTPKADNVVLVQNFEAGLPENSLVTQNLYLMGLPLSVTERTGLNYSDTNTTTSFNVMSDFSHKLSNIRTVKVPFNYNYTNNSIKDDYTVTNSDIETTTPTLDKNIDSVYSKENNNTSNILNVKNNDTNSNNEELDSSKTSVLVSTETPTFQTLIGKMNTVYIDGLKKATNAETPLISEVDFKSITNDTIEKKSNNQFVIESTDDSYIERNRVNNISDPQNFTSSSDTTQSIIIKTPINYSGSITTEPYQVLDPVLLENRKQVSPYALRKGDSNLLTTQRTFDKSVSDYVKKTSETIQMIPIVPSVVNDTTLGPTNFAETDSRDVTTVSIKDKQSFTDVYLLSCQNHVRGRFADKNNCRKYFICIGRIQPILGECPINTVFSEIKKQCTKNLSHCVRNNQFRCVQEGRFIDVWKNNIYYICVNNNKAYIRFQFQCQNGYHLNKTSVRCVNDIKFNSHIMSMSIDSDSNKGSDQSTIERKSKEKKQPKKDEKFICTQEGKFSDPEDCRRYYVCSKNSKSIFRRRTKKCDSDEVFHREKKKCVDGDSYECN